jgi:hypothetical protein
MTGAPEIFAFVAGEAPLNVLLGHGGARRDLRLQLETDGSLTFAVGKTRTRGALIKSALGRAP